MKDQQRPSQSPPPPPTPDSMEPLNTSSINAEESAGMQNLTEQQLSTEDENLVLDNVPQEENNVDASRDTSCQTGTLDGIMDSGVNQAIVSAPQTQSLLYRGHGNAPAEWEDYSRYINVENMEAGSTGIYNENPPLMFHSGYGYNPQLPPYGPYSPVTTPLPPASGDSHLYSQQFAFPGPYYPQTPPPSMPYLTAPTSMPQPNLTMPVDHQTAFLADNSSSNGMMFGPGPDYPLPYTSFGAENFAGNSGNPGLYDGFGSGGFLSDLLQSPNGAGPMTPLYSPAASPQPIGTLGSFGQSIEHLSTGMASQQQNSMYGFGSALGSYERGYFHGGMYQQRSKFGGYIPSFGNNVQNFMSDDKGRRRGKGNVYLCNCNGPLDFLNEQNRGPRASRPKNVSTEQNLAGDNKNSNSTASPNRELYNRVDFSTDYKDAKFFVIKSYSEDNVHKSIKYGVWASTANGNRKLDSAYHEAKEKGNSCPVFLFFSVNASAQFCGVAEMIGPVDFEKSVDYWQQDKWSGQFPVKWHIIKDAPNNLFRHIILDNNDNKPVTNSRDTQEIKVLNITCEGDVVRENLVSDVGCRSYRGHLVKLEQGLEMLSIFKKHEGDLSVLDDFDFYEEREKAMQERKSRQHQHQHVNSPSVVDGPLKPAGDVINQISKTFAQVVRLQESSKITPPDKTSSSSTTTPEAEASKPKPEDLKPPAKPLEIVHCS